MHRGTGEPRRHSPVGGQTGPQGTPARLWPSSGLFDAVARRAPQPPPMRLVEPVLRQGPLHRRSLFAPGNRRTTVAIPEDPIWGGTRVCRTSAMRHPVVCAAHICRRTQRRITIEGEATPTCRNGTAMNGGRCPQWSCGPAPGAGRLMPAWFVHHPPRRRGGSDAPPESSL
jgi:hypothetical protein